MANQEGNQLLHFKIEKQLQNEEVLEILNNPNLEYFVVAQSTVMLYRSQLNPTVFKLRDDGEISLDFDVYIDCELQELSQMIKIASMKSVQPRKLVVDNTPKKQASIINHNNNNQSLLGDPYFDRKMSMSPTVKRESIDELDEILLDNKMSKTAEKFQPKVVLFDKST